ncbi:hypothetical protein H0486_02235 [Lachnospiraceae bacterium MD1]|uniref:DUF2975 domain-containing protein n=1 Tax=Variimorphobacter saccharofermentans TaxID=2755051 RepID=A0A839JVL0_9FIRM|nr:hypothetical protein [Variimorphobacter saccharofermentans]MBB2181695.1 hypothetical protein [Variimorphobacter saccharofermentans]
MKKILVALLIEGIAAIALSLFMKYYIGMEEAILLLYIPFDLIGKGLRCLSLQSSIGNIIALIIYALLCLTPIFWLVFRKLRKQLNYSDILLPIISIYSFYMLFLFVNPNLMYRHVPELFMDESALSIVRLSLAIIFFTLVIGYLIIRMLTTLSQEKEENRMIFLCRRLQVLLYIISILYTFLLGYFSTFELFSQIDQRSFTTGTQMNQVYVLLSFVLKTVPVLFTIVTLVSGIVLLTTISTKHKQEEEVEAAKRMGMFSRRTAFLTVGCNIALNLFQLVFSSQLNDTSIVLNVSLAPLVISISAMILSGFFKETKELYEENEMII